MKIGNICRRIILSAVLLVLSSALYSQKTGNTYDKFYADFKNPPHEALPYVYHWWLGGYVDTVRLREEMEGFKKQGISGFTLYEIGSRDSMIKSGPEFLGKESLETIRFAVTEAKRLGLNIGMNVSSSWNAGGNWIPPKYAAKSIYQSEVTVTGGKNIKTKLPFPEISELDSWGKKRMIEFGSDGRPVFYEEIAIVAVPDIGDRLLDTSVIMDITRFFNPKTERISWQAPKGNWKIYRFVCSNSGENLVLPSKNSAGPIQDHYDADATTFNFNYVINKLESVLGDLRQTALKSLYMASYEAKTLVWTTTLPAVFEKINGYSPTKFLPILFDKEKYSQELINNFKADFQSTLSELMINNFYVKSSEICQKHGLKNNSESGGPGQPLHNVTAEPIKALGVLGIPRGEFWVSHSVFNKDGLDILRVVKEVAAASHIYGKKIVEMEAFTSFQQWQEGPFEMKPFGDRAFAEGMNKVVIHGSSHNPRGTGYPGIAYGAGTHYNDKRVWWPMVKPFNEYLARVSMVAQQADFFADVVFYYGDTIPNFGGQKNGRFTSGKGYDYEIINTEKLLELRYHGGKLILPSTGASFSILALPKEYEINPEVLVHLNSLVNQGAIIIGPKPEKLAVRKMKSGISEMHVLFNRLWKAYDGHSFLNKAGKHIYYNIRVEDALQKIGIGPDFSYSNDDFGSFDYIHYQKDEIDFYFVVNKNDETVTRNMTFRQTGKMPEVWNPVTGEIAKVSIYKDKNNGITLPVSFAPYGSTIVVFRPGVEKHLEPFDEDENFPISPLTYTENGVEFWESGIIKLHLNGKPFTVKNIIQKEILEGAWKVSFQEKRGAPDRMIFPELISWTESPVNGVKYFSGIARYEKNFVVSDYDTSDRKTKVYIDLGNLSNVGDVWLNGYHLGITWAKPYRIDITRFLKRGPNILQIDIANTWSNRLVGDAIKGEHYTSTNIRGSYIKGLPFFKLPEEMKQLDWTQTYLQWKDVPLIPSGLFGPVALIKIKPFVPEY